MHCYKRNQVEEAIAAALAKAGVDPAADLRVRIKRLLETDRALASRAEGDEPARASAFYTGEAPGRGVEIWFSSYEAFALLLGVLLMQHRWPQGTAVRILRQARPRLEPEHDRILAQDADELVDEAEVLRQAKPGMAVVAVTDPVFLAIVTEWRGQTDPDSAPHALIVCRGENDLMHFRRANAPPGTSMTVLEVAAPAHSLQHYLNHTQPKARGRTRR